jgi:GPH family glycoside/pentoside/hexuronide:cation symporter
MEKHGQVSSPVMASYGVGKFLAEFLTGAFGAIVFMYYETEIGLSTGYAALATVIYSLWNAVNDPILGFITNKNAPLAKKLGRRFPWIIIGLLLSAASFVLIFTVPESMRINVKTNPLPVFIWMVLTICVYDGVYSLWEVNYQSVYPDKFRTHQQRTKSAAIATAIGVLGVAAGFVVPPLFFRYGEPSTYLVSSWVVAAVVVVGALLIIPGVRESKAMIHRFMEQKRTQKEEPKFFESLFRSLKHKDFLAFILLLFLYQSGTMSMTSSIHYVGNYILNVPSSGTTIIFAGMLIGSLISIPAWTLLSKKLKNNQKMLIISAITMAVFAFPMTFIRSIGGFTLFMGLWGLGFGGFWTFMTPAMADIVDSIVVKEKRRDDGILMGIRAFFMRFSYASQAIVFWITHKLTHFAVDPYSESAKFGISLHMATIPALFFLVGAYVFYRLNSLTPDKVEQHKRELAKLDI